MLYYVILHYTMIYYTSLHYTILLDALLTFQTTSHPTEYNEWWNKSKLTKAIVLNVVQQYISSLSICLGMCGRDLVPFCSWQHIWRWEACHEDVAQKLNRFCTRHFSSFRRDTGEMSSSGKWFAEPSRHEDPAAKRALFKAKYRWPGFSLRAKHIVTQRQNLVKKPRRRAPTVSRKETGSDSRKSAEEE